MLNGNRGIRGDKGSRGYNEISGSQNPYTYYDLIVTEIVNISSES